MHTQHPNENLMKISSSPKNLNLNTSIRPAEPCIMVIFGATGDLTKRKLIPALYNLMTHQVLSNHFAVLGVGRDPFNDQEFRGNINKQLCEFADCHDSGTQQKNLIERLYYMHGTFEDPATFQNLAVKLKEIDAKHQTQNNFLYYLATPPTFFDKIVEKLGEAGLAKQSEQSWRRVIIEKPFGRDYSSARALNLKLQKYFEESQIYRIDHYLGKETVQNILVFRFANGIFEPIWNRGYIDHVQITVSEHLGVEHRGTYYEEAGALRDMVPNHLLQLLTYVTMEPPISFDADAVRNEKTKILEAIQPVSNEQVITNAVRGQYGPGTMPDGKRVPGYRQEPKVAPDSKMETYIALKLLIDDWRWADVPFYIRTGKRLAEHTTEIAIIFKRAPFALFRNTAVNTLDTNVLVLRIQPDEGISLSFSAKIPGPILQIGNMGMDFCYSNYFGIQKTATGYETLLYDCMKGDSTLFLRGDNIEDAWKVVTPILDVWSSIPPRNFPNYEAGTWGPPDADLLLTKDGRKWRNSFVTDHMHCQT